MPRHDPNVPPPFDQGIFLVHYNRGKDAFQEGRYGEARRDLELAQRMRPDDLDVLNLLGLVYFKTNSLPEAEVIYRRLVEENGDVFILHSNLGLILFKQSKIDEAEKYLSKAVELRPNYAKSHLYLGLLYKQKKKYGLALEHLKFAGAEKAAKEVEAELALQASRGGVRLTSRPVEPPQEIPKEIPKASVIPPPLVPESVPMSTMPGNAARAPRAELVPAPTTPPAVPVLAAANSDPRNAARKLQEAVDETPEGDQPRIDIGSRKIEGASRTFSLHENGFLEINFNKSVRVKRGTVSSYSGNLKFGGEAGLLGTTAATLIKAEGSGKIFCYEKGRKTFLLDLNDEFIYVEGSNLLAMEESLSYRVEPIYDSSYQSKIDTVKIFGKGSLAISTFIEPLTLRVTRDYPLSISSQSLVAWTGNVIPTVIDEDDLKSVMIDASAHAFKIRFDGEGVVVSEQ